MSPATKQKISNAQKKRWRESPTLRATMESKLKVSHGRFATLSFMASILMHVLLSLSDHACCYCVQCPALIIDAGPACPSQHHCPKGCAATCLLSETPVLTGLCAMEQGQEAQSGDETAHEPGQEGQPAQQDDPAQD